MRNLHNSDQLLEKTLGMVIFFIIACIAISWYASFVGVK